MRENMLLKFLDNITEAYEIFEISIEEGVIL